MDLPLNVFDIKLLFFSSEWNETWWSCSNLCVLQLHQVSLNSDDKTNSFMSNTFPVRPLGAGELGLRDAAAFWNFCSN